MHNFFSNKHLIVLMVALLLSMGLISYSIMVRNSDDTPPVIQTIGNDVVGIGGRIVAAPGNWVRGGLNDIHDLLDTYSENRKLKAEVEDLAQTKVRLATTQRENKALKAQLKLNGTLTDYTQISAAVMLRSPTDWRNIMVINKGAGAGVKKNMPVMAGSGLIGRVIEVNRTNAKVEMLTTDNKAANRFAAQITTKNGALVEGVITSYKTTSGDLVMSQLNTNKAIQRGDQVITSGLGGATPKGLLIGTVASVQKDDYSLANTVTIKPAANFSDVSVVTVIARTIEGD